MNIALCNRPETWPGGDMVQLRGYQKALQKLEHTANYLHYPIRDNSYDEAWIFHMNFWWAYNHAVEAVKRDIPYRLFALYYPNLSEGVTKANMQWMLDNAKAVYCLSAEEALQLKETGFNVNTNRYNIIDNGVDKSLFYPMGETRDGVLSVGRFLPDKGHHFVIEACKKLRLPLTVVGFKSDPDYEERCIRLAENSDTHICSDLTQNVMALLYNKSKVIVCASVSERNNLAILEGAACGATPVDSVYNMAYPYHKFYITNPHAEDGLSTTIKYAWDNPQDHSSEICDWSDVVKDILDNG